MSKREIDPAPVEMEIEGESGRGKHAQQDLRRRLIDLKNQLGRRSADLEAARSALKESEDRFRQIAAMTGEWIWEQARQVLPKSQIGKAMAYTANRWDALSGFLLDGTLEIDNNLVENAIRPLALGRKNYLFAGSHKAAQRAAMAYSLLGTCKLHGVNPREWLTHVLTNILQTKYNDVPSLYPQNFSTKQSVG
jgi:hypothetical protein